MRTRSRSAPVTRARVSTACMRGARPMKFSIMRSMSLRILKFSPILIGVSLMPSSFRLRAESGMPPGSQAPRLGLVRERAGPRDQLAVMEDRHHRHLVAVVDAAVARLVRVEDVAVADADRRIGVELLHDVLHRQSR